MTTTRRAIAGLTTSAAAGTAVAHLSRTGWPRFAVGAAIGITVGAAVMYAAHARWAEAHHYRRVWLEVTRVRDLADMADHDHRNARRWGEALTAMRAIHDDIVGDLLDTVAEQARQLERLQQPHRRDPIPPYGPRRQAA